MMREEPKAIFPKATEIHSGTRGMPTTEDTLNLSFCILASAYTHPLTRKPLV